MFSHKIITDQVNSPCISSKNEHPWLDTLLAKTLVTIDLQLLPQEGQSSQVCTVYETPMSRTMFSKKTELKQRLPSLEIGHFSVNCSKALDLIQRLLCVIVYKPHSICQKSMILKSWFLGLHILVLVFWIGGGIGVIVENKPLVKFIRNYIQDLRSIFSKSSLVRISMTWFPFQTVVCAVFSKCQEKNDER